MESCATSFAFFAGLPWTAWLLWIAAVGLGLVIELIFYFNHRRVRRQEEPQPGRPDRKD